MKIVLIKSGKFSFHPVYGPVKDCVKDEIVDILDAYAKQLIEAGWAQEVNKLMPPWEKTDWDQNGDDAKELLQSYVSIVYGTSIDKRKSVANIIKDIKKIAGL